LSAVASFGMDTAGGQTLATRAGNAWDSFTARRRIGAAGGPNAIYSGARSAMTGGR